MANHLGVIQTVPILAAALVDGVDSQMNTVNAKHASISAEGIKVSLSIYSGSRRDWRKWGHPKLIDKRCIIFQVKESRKMLCPLISLSKHMSIFHCLTINIIHIHKNTK